MKAQKVWLNIYKNILKEKVVYFLDIALRPPGRRSWVGTDTKTKMQKKDAKLQRREHVHLTLLELSVRNLLHHSHAPLLS